MQLVQAIKESSLIDIKNILYDSQMLLKAESVKPVGTVFWKIYQNFGIKPLVSDWAKFNLLDRLCYDGYVYNKK